MNKPQYTTVTYQVGFFLVPEYCQHYIEYNQAFQKKPVKAKRKK